MGYKIRRLVTACLILNVNAAVVLMLFSTGHFTWPLKAGTSFQLQQRDLLATFGSGDDVEITNSTTRPVPVTEEDAPSPDHHGPPVISVTCYETNPQCGKSVRRPSQLVLALLAIFLGMLGVDRCYMGFVCCGILKAVTLGGCTVWFVVDIVLSVIGDYLTADGCCPVTWNSAAAQTYGI